MPMPFIDTIEDFLLFAAAAINMAIAVLILVKRPTHIINASFFLFVSGMTAWMSGILLLYITHDFGFDKLALGGGIVMLLGITVFARTFPAGPPVSARFAATLAPLFLAAALLPYDVFIEGIAVDASGLVEPINGPLFPFYVANAIGYFLYAVFLFARSYARSVGQAKMQLTYLLTGIGILALSVAVFDVLLPFAGIYQLNLLGPAACLVFVLMAAYAIVRHQLMDIRIVIQRSLIYSFLVGGIVGCYVLLISAFGTLLGAASDAAFFASAVITSVGGIFTAPLIERFFRKATDRIFFKDTYDYAAALHTLSGVLHANVEFDDLVRESEEALASMLRACSVHIMLGPAQEDEDAGPDGRAQPLFVPIELDGAEIGRIRLGPKRSGDPYSREDLQLLGTFAYQAATALSRAQLYAAAREHAEELEKKVTERTRELSEARERERQMLNDISHNLQTPLTVLQTRLDHLKPQLADDAEVRSFEQSLADFSGFIYDLLSLARLESGHGHARHVPLDLSALTSELAEEIGVIAAARGIAVHTEIEPELRILGNARRLRETLMNIASNSLKYMRTDSSEKEILFSARAEGTEAVITVSDSGIGIAAPDLPRIFDRFYRGAKAPHGTNGTGLGLSIAKRIVEQHDGTIQAASTPGEGTAVRIALPLGAAGMNVDPGRKER